MNFRRNMSLSALCVALGLVMTTGCGLGTEAEGAVEGAQLAGTREGSDGGAGEGEPDFPRLLVHGDDLSAEGWEAFSLDRTLRAIIDTNQGQPGEAQATSEQAAALLGTLMDGLSVTDGEEDHGFLENSVSGLPMRVEDIDVREVFRSVDTFEPIALFNRLDLAPADWSDCGEFRIVYQANEGTFFLIFEAKLPNPLLRPDGRGEQLGCKPAVNFWAGLGDLSPAERAAELARFFYEGGNGLSAVVRHANYAEGLGQVRTNHFNTNPFFSDVWQLREFRTENAADGAAVFSVDTVKGNALAEFYSGDADEGLDRTEQVLFNSLRGDFLEGFLGGEDENGTPTVPARLVELLAPELDETGETPVVGGFGLTIEEGYNEFSSGAQEGVLEGNALSPREMGELQAAIDALLGQDADTEDGVTADHVINRVNVQTCGGCHQSANNAFVGPGQQWPISQGFTHVNRSEVSAALNQALLPARNENLDGAVAEFQVEYDRLSAADMDGSGIVDGADLGLFLSEWGGECDEETEEPIRGDLNRDCIVDGGDIGLLLAMWGQRYFPENPTTLRSFAPGVLASAPVVVSDESPLETLARGVAEAEDESARARALDRLRDARQAAEERNREQAGAFVQVRPVH